MTTPADRETLPTSKPPIETTAGTSSYACVLGTLRVKAKELGYALALHGSMVRDLDLVAVPWVENAAPPEVLVEALRVILDGSIIPTGTRGGRWDAEAGKFVDAIVENPARKPHGRLAWNIHLGGQPVIDLSVMPPTPAAPSGLPMVGGVRIVQIGRGFDGWFVLGQRSEADGGSEVWLSTDGNWRTRKTRDLRKLYWPTRAEAEAAVRQFAEREQMATLTLNRPRCTDAELAALVEQSRGKPPASGFDYDGGGPRQTIPVATPAPAGRELPDGDSGFCELLRCPACKAIIESDELEPVSEQPAQEPADAGFDINELANEVARDYAGIGAIHGWHIREACRKAIAKTIERYGGWRRADAGEGGEYTINKLRDVLQVANETSRRRAAERDELREKLAAAEKERGDLTEFAGYLTHYLSADDDAHSSWELTDDRWKQLAIDSASARKSLTTAQAELDAAKSLLRELTRERNFRVYVHDSFLSRALRIIDAAPPAESEVGRG